MNGNDSFNNKEIKDNALSLMDSSISLSYTKTNKLTIALYMVTDILDTDEPIRRKLRTLGVEILSDVTSMRGPVITVKVANKIQETLYLIDMAETLNMISRMNSRILKNEFLELRKSLQVYIDNANSFAGKSTLSEFFLDEGQMTSMISKDENDFSIGHLKQTNIGVQKGSTLLKALSDRINKSAGDLSDKKTTNRSPLASRSGKSIGSRTSSSESFDSLKRDRREEIIRIIKSDPSNTTEGVSITDIRSKATGSLKTSSEKTLQRELVSMVKDNVLKKTGDKRWSRYYVR